MTRRALQGDVVRSDLYVVSDGAEALDFLLHRGPYEARRPPRPDIILMDLNMPKLDGRQVLTKIRENASLKDIPVIILTTSAQEEEIVRTYRLGCNSFITKPVQVDKFIQTVREVGEYWFELVTLPSERHA